MQLRLGRVGREQSGAHAPPNFQTGMPSRFALSARLSWIPVPGKCMTPIGSSSSMASLRLNGAAMDQDHVGMLGANLVEAIPDQTMVVEVEATCECDLRSWRHHDLGLGAA